MAKTIDINLVIKTAGSEKTIEQANQNISDLQKTIEKLGSTSQNAFGDKLNNALKSSEENLDSLIQTAKNGGEALTQTFTKGKDSAQEFSNQSIRTLGSLRKELANLVSQSEELDSSSEEFKKLQIQIGQTEKAIRKSEGAFGDATDKLKTLSGSGVERAQSSFRLLREGITTLDFGKLKIGLQGAAGGFKALGGAIAATGIGALVAGVSLLIANFDKLKNAGGLVGQVFSFIGDTITNVLDGITAISDAIGLTDTKAAAAQERADERNKKAIEDRIGLVKRVEESYNKQIELAKAAGQDTSKLEQQSAAAQKQILQTNIAFLENVSKTSSVARDLVADLLKSQKDALSEIEQDEKVSAATRQKAAIDAEKARQDKLKSLREQFRVENELEAINRREREKIAEAESIGATETDIINIQRKFREERFNLAKKEGDDIKALRLNQFKQTQEELQLTASGLTPLTIPILIATPDDEIEAFFEGFSEGLQRLIEVGSFSVDLFSKFTSSLDQIEKNRLKTGEKLSGAAQKRIFNRNKAASIAQAGISVAGSILKSIEIFGAPPSPKGIAGILAAVTTGAVQIAAIKSQKFNPDGPTDGGSTPQSSSINLGSLGADTQISPSATLQQLGAFAPTEQGQFQVFVTETDISRVVNRVDVIETRSQFG